MDGNNIGTFDLERGAWRHYLESEYTSGKNLLEVLLPDSYDRSKKYRVLYVLPVEANQECVFGDGIKEISRHGLHNKYDIICACPYFDTLPWYGNNPDNPRVRNEDYIVKTIVPFVEGHYSTLGKRNGRLLLGFSKSGWGALTLLMRNPDFFGFAASWDAPLMLDENNFAIWGSAVTFGTPANFAEYLPTRLARRSAGHFKERTRIALAGEKSFGPNGDPLFPVQGGSHTAEYHRLLGSLGIKHIYDDKLPMAHHWNSGWVPELLAMLMSLTHNSQMDLK